MAASAESNDSRWHLLRHGRTVGRCPHDGGRQPCQGRGGTRPMNPAYMASPPSPIELLILTGFLGSGKTTLLSAYLRQPQVVDVAVIVNEIGEIDLDGAVLSATAAKVPMALLSNGCVCCAVGGDLPGTIAMLIEKRATQGLPPLLRIVLETTGLA